MGMKMPSNFNIPNEMFRPHTMPASGAAAAVFSNTKYSVSTQTDQSKLMLFIFNLSVNVICFAKCRLELILRRG